MIHIQLQDCLLNQFFRSDPLGNHYKVIEHVLDTTFRFLLHAPGAYWRARLASVSSHLKTERSDERHWAKLPQRCHTVHSRTQSQQFSSLPYLWDASGHLRINLVAVIWQCLPFVLSIDEKDGSAKSKRYEQPPALSTFSMYARGQTSIQGSS